MAAMRTYRSSNDALANRSNRPSAALQDRASERARSARKRSSTEGVVCAVTDRSLQRAPNASVRPGAFIRPGHLPQLGRRRIRAPFRVRISCYLRQDGGTGGHVLDEAPFGTVSGAASGSGRVRIRVPGLMQCCRRRHRSGPPLWRPSLRKCVGHKAGAGSQS
jgi:hypothetical protein